MRPLDLYSQSPNPTPEQLLAVCNRFNLEVLEKPKNEAWDSTLEAAQRLAEQILGHYDSLQAVSDALVAFRGHKTKLPSTVLSLFLYASAQEHSSLKTMINEIEEVYKDNLDDSLEPHVQNMWRDTMLSMMPRPSLWCKDGNLQYSPYGFSKVHPQTFRRQFNNRYNEGEIGIQRILDCYPLMSEVSRTLMDKTLCDKVYASLMPSNHPIRGLLSSKLNDIQDGLQRFNQLFGVLDDEPNDAGFDQRLDHAFTLMHALPASQASEIISESINKCIIDWMTDGENGYMYFTDPVVVVPNLVKLLEHARPFGFNALDEVSRNVRYMTNRTLNKDMIEALLDEGVIDDIYNLDTCAAWKQAALTAADDGFYLSLGLDNKYLTMLLKIKPTQRLKEELKKTEFGSEAVLTLDLGL